MSFAPKLSALPAAQRALWPELKQVPRQFVLYGGTALALRFGHRISVDFDFFASAPIKPEELVRSVSWLRTATIRQSGIETLTVEVAGPQTVKVSFFGLTLGRVNNPELTDDGVALVASALDVAACKMAAIQTRAESKDYLDIRELMQQGVKIADALGAARAIYGGQFNPLISLKALGSFADGDLRKLPADLRRELHDASCAVREITNFERLPGGLAPLATD
jgi:hypothetical protein